MTTLELREYVRLIGGRALVQQSKWFCQQVVIKVGYALAMAAASWLISPVPLEGLLGKFLDCALGLLLFWVCAYIYHVIREIVDNHSTQQQRISELQDRLDRFEAVVDFPCPNMDVGNAINYVLSRTAFGVGKTRGDVARTLWEAAADGRLRVWELETDSGDEPDWVTVPPTDISRRVKSIKITFGDDPWPSAKLCQEQIESLWPPSVS